MQQLLPPLCILCSRAGRRLARQYSLQTCLPGAVRALLGAAGGCSQGLRPWYAVCQLHLLLDDLLLANILLLPRWKVPSQSLILLVLLLLLFPLLLVVLLFLLAHVALPSLLW